MPKQIFFERIKSTLVVVFYEFYLGSNNFIRTQIDTQLLRIRMHLDISIYAWQISHYSLGIYLNNKLVLEIFSG